MHRGNLPSELLKICVTLPGTSPEVGRLIREAKPQALGRIALYRNNAIGIQEFQCPITRFHQKTALPSSEGDWQVATYEQVDQVRVVNVTRCTPLLPCLVVVMKELCTHRENIGLLHNPTASLDGYILIGDPLEPSVQPQKVVLENGRQAPAFLRKEDGKVWVYSYARRIAGGTSIFRTTPELSVRGTCWDEVMRVEQSLTHPSFEYPEGSGYRFVTSAPDGVLYRTNFSSKGDLEMVHSDGLAGTRVVKVGEKFMLSVTLDRETAHYVVSDPPPSSTVKSFLTSLFFS